MRIQHTLYTAFIFTVQRTHPKHTMIIYTRKSIRLIKWANEHPSILLNIIYTHINTQSELEI